ncbi:hypothetical protein E4U21_003764, partial [Claviceps maximensis]
MKASHAALLLLTCHSGNVMAAPAAQADALTSGSELQRNALPLDFVNNLEGRGSAEEDSFDDEVSSFRTFGNDKIVQDDSTSGFDEESQFVVNSMLTGVFDIMAELPKDHVKDLPKRGEGVHQAVQEAAAEAEELGLSKHLVTAMFEKMNHGPTGRRMRKHHTDLGDSRKPMATILKAFFEALKFFFSELKKAREASQHGGPGIQLPSHP